MNKTVGWRAVRRFCMCSIFYDVCCIDEFLHCLRNLPEAALGVIDLIVEIQIAPSRNYKAHQVS